MCQASCDFPARCGGTACGLTVPVVGGPSAPRSFRPGGSEGLAILTHSFLQHLPAVSISAARGHIEQIESLLTVLFETGHLPGVILSVQAEYLQVL